MCPYSLIASASETNHVFGLCFSIVSPKSRPPGYVPERCDHLRPRDYPCLWALLFYSEPKVTVSRLCPGAVITSAPETTRVFRLRFCIASSIHLRTGTPILLVGLVGDLRNDCQALAQLRDNGISVITQSQG